MLGFLSWIPVIGPIITQILGPIVQIFTKAKDTELGKYQTDAQVTGKIIDASTQTLTVFKDDVSVIVCRDLIMAPGSIWCGLYLWDKIMAIRHPELVWSVAPLDGPLAMLPYALLTFFFGAAALGIWKRR